MGVLLQGFYFGPGRISGVPSPLDGDASVPFGGTTLRRKRSLSLKRDSRPSGCPRRSNALRAPFRVVTICLMITISVPKPKRHDSHPLRHPRTIATLCGHDARQWY
jgi:hypothetical protein